MSLVALARRTARRTVDRLQGTPPGGLSLRPFTPMKPRTEGVKCNVCRWHGETFEGVLHCESAICPRCNAIGRDRWLFHCLVTRVKVTKETRLLETSPRMPQAYREAMGRRLDYISSDYDLRAHKADIALDLQKMDLPDNHLDVLMTSHVLEHVPDTDAALSETFRVLKPGGSLILLVPVPQGVTAPPVEPEFHGDMTPVFWRFGPDLTDRLRSHGFDTALLCTDDFKRHAEAGDTHWDEGIAPEWDIDSIMGAVKVDDLTPICDDDLARTAALRPSYMYLAWHARKP